MTPAFELAAFAVKDGDQAAMLAERPAMIEALHQAFPGLLAAWLSKRDDGSWLDVILWRTRAEAQTAAKHAGNVLEAKAWFRHIAHSPGLEHLDIADQQLFTAAPGHPGKHPDDSPDGPPDHARGSRQATAGRARTCLDPGETDALEDTMNDLSGKTTIVVGASRGLGHGIATAFAEAGARVVAVSRTTAAFPEPSGGVGTIRSETADASDATVPARLLDRYHPHAVILVAGATPHYRPLHQQTWETFSVNWHTDVKMTFCWLREALLTPMRPGSKVVVVSSGAAINGSPLSGGYAGAKATQRFVTAYAQDEASRAGLDITFTAVLPAAHGPAAPMTGVGEPAVRAYAARAGQPLQDYLQQLGPQVTPEITGTALAGLVQADAGSVAPAYLLTSTGLQKLP